MEKVEVFKLDSKTDDYVHLKLSEKLEKLFEFVNDIELRNVKITEIVLNSNGKISQFGLRNSRKRFITDFYYDKIDCGFVAQTGGYGSLNQSDYKEFLQVVSDTYVDLKTLNSYDWEELLAEN